MITFFWILFFIIVLIILAYQRASLSVWTLSIFIYLLLLTELSDASVIILSVFWIIFVLIGIFLNLKWLRRLLISRHLYQLFNKAIPRISATEKIALNAGTVGWEGQLFAGFPNWTEQLKQPEATLTKEEQVFLDNEVTQLCEMLNDWEITHRLKDLPEAVWDFLKKQGFFGLIIPKKYQGKGFSPLAHSAIVTKIASISSSAATVVSVPNSLGPAELLLKYGTEKQKKYYLPRLASGEEIPCFALTSPYAGSDANAMTDHGVVKEGQIDGKTVLGIELNFKKRYITLAPVATLIGLAFKLYDPDRLLSKQEKLGITCALIPANQPAISIGRRHFPLNSAFPNGPIEGRHVFIPIDAIIGGKKMAGQGWRMLMETLAAGRAISLPAITAGGAKLAAYVTGAYAHIRKQFDVPIAAFEGIKDPLAKIAGNTYIIEAARLFTLSEIQAGEAPALASAIIKNETTERGRKIVIHAMDIHGGKGICLGPHNYIGRSYQVAPIAITVEGANILTRNMIIFGQGAMRCHPYLSRLIQTSELKDSPEGVKQFDKLLFEYLGAIGSNKVRAFILGLTSGRLGGHPKSKAGYYYQQLTRYSAAFAFTSNAVILTLGGRLKRLESLSGRLADIVSLLYLGSAVLKRFYVQGEPSEDWPLIKWVMGTLLQQIQERFTALFANLPGFFLRLILTIVVFPSGKRKYEPNDSLTHQVADLFIDQTETRERLAEGVFLKDCPNNPIGKINTALALVIKAAPLEKKLLKAEKQKLITGYTWPERLESAVQGGILTPEEGEMVEEAAKARFDVIQVDDFGAGEL